MDMKASIVSATAYSTAHGAPGAESSLAELDRQRAEDRRWNWLPGHLRVRVKAAADAEQITLRAWLVRAVEQTLDGKGKSHG